MWSYPFSTFIFYLLSLRTNNNGILVLFAETTVDGEFVWLIIGVRNHHLAFLEDGHDGGMVLEHGEGPLQ